MIQVKGLCKGYGSGDNYVVHDIDMQIKKGTIHGLIGHNGSGKTTIIKCLTGIFPPDGGEILVEGESVYNNVQVKNRIGYVADTNQMFRGYNMRKMAKFYRDVYPDFSMEDYHRLAEMFLVDSTKTVSQMSKGQQMRASFVLNMARHPEIMILDEPTAGLDVIAKQQLLDCLVSAVENDDMTVVISSHHLSELEKVCDTITMINQGKVQMEDALDEVTAQVVKYQLVFAGGAPEQLYERKDVCHMSNIGSVYTVVLRRRVAGFEEEMKALGATLVEEMPVSLEESFIYINKESTNMGGGASHE